jgi:hypothetical protein
MEEDRQRRNNRRKMRRQKYDDVSGDEEENLSSYLLSMTSGARSLPAAASQGKKETIFDQLCSAKYLPWPRKFQFTPFEREKRTAQTLRHRQR